MKVTDRCVMCGEILPNGTQVCLCCTMEILNADTAEKVKKELEYYGKVHGHDNKEKAIQGVFEAVRGMWIKCTDRLPDTYEKVLVTYKKSASKNAEAIDIDRYSYKSYKWEAHGKSVIAWMPLPKPYKESDA